MIYDKNDSVYFKLNHQTYTYATNVWADSDPDVGFPTITIIDPSGSVKIAADIMVKKATGKFEYLYTISLSALTGYWTGFIDVANAGYPDRETFGFEVK